MNNFFIAQTFGKSSNYTDIPNHLFKEHNVKRVSATRMAPESGSA